jgi:SHAQKYF class myb-like DNA-binding protein
MLQQHQLLLQQQRRLPAKPVQRRPNIKSHLDAAEGLQAALVSPVSSTSGTFSSAVTPQMADGSASTHEPPKKSGRWTDEEHQDFVKGLRKYGKNWSLISHLVKSRTTVQVRTHAQKYFLKQQKQGVRSGISEAEAAARTAHGRTRLGTTELSSFPLAHSESPFSSESSSSSSSSSSGGGSGSDSDTIAGAVSSSPSSSSTRGDDEDDTDDEVHGSEVALPTVVSVQVQPVAASHEQSEPIKQESTWKQQQEQQEQQQLQQLQQQQPEPQQSHPQPLPHLVLRSQLLQSQLQSQLRSWTTPAFFLGLSANAAPQSPTAARNIEEAAGYLVNLWDVNNPTFVR